jgi:PEP-CTERM motif-containing protein
METVEMLKRSLFALTMFGVLSTGAFADSLVTYESADDLANLAPGASASVDIVLSNLDGDTTQFAGGGFAFAGDSGLGLIDFSWADVPFADGNTWFATGGLSPEAVRFFAGEVIPADGLLLGTLSFTAPNDLGDYVQQTNPTNFTDQSLGAITLAAGSGSFGVSVVPEPATLALLAFGGLTAIRRRR